MIITVASFKGGVGKSTTSIHLASYFSERVNNVLLLDGDANSSVSNWAERGNLPFQVADERHAAKYARDADHIIIDTAARPTEEDLKTLIGGCDLLILPCVPDVLSLEALVLTVETLKKLNSDSYKVLLTIVPPKPNRDGEQARKSLLSANLPLFNSSIRRFQAYKKAALEGLTVDKVNDSNSTRAWQDYQDVGKEIEQMKAEQL
jgi:chromosome partitioning protein